MKGKPKRLVEGRHLQELGEAPGPFYGYAIKAAYQAQLNCEFNNIDDAVDWISSNIDRLKEEFNKQNA